ncbi:hypothetical protein FB451DRAFT_66409 [Mycena latifolia]|nr:hypothetical protein FB451DRAFT_66409 [Mycena latifolia]
MSSPALPPLFIIERKRAGIACSNCRRRKIKCISSGPAQEPCERCAKRDLSCEYVAVADSTQQNPPQGRSSKHDTPPQMGAHTPTAPSHFRDSYYHPSPYTNYVPPPAFQVEPQGFNYAHPSLYATKSPQRVQPSPIHDSNKYPQPPALKGPQSPYGASPSGYGMFAPADLWPWHQATEYPSMQLHACICAPGPCFCGGSSPSDQ